MEGAALAVVAGLTGAFVVGPWLADAVQRWIGWRVVLPLFLGGVPRRAELGPTQRLAARSRGDRALAVVTGALFAGTALRFGWTASLIPVLVLEAGLVALVAVDLICWRLPTRFIYLDGAAVVAGIVVASLLLDVPRSLEGMVVGGVVYLFVLGGMHLLSPQMLGFGDVRLGTLIGLAVGWMGWRSDQPIDGPVGWVLLAIFLASLTGAVAGLVVLAMRRRAARLSDRPWREAYPFGPWLAFAGLVAILLAAPGPT